jgi:hypothetical protein
VSTRHLALDAADALQPDANPVDDTFFFSMCAISSACDVLENAAIASTLHYFNGQMSEVSVRECSFIND